MRSKSKISIIVLSLLVLTGLISLVVAYSSQQDGAPAFKNGHVATYGVHPSSRVISRAKELSEQHRRRSQDGANLQQKFDESYEQLKSDYEAALSNTEHLRLSLRETKENLNAEILQGSDESVIQRLKRDLDEQSERLLDEQRLLEGRYKTFIAAQDQFAARIMAAAEDK